MAVADAANAGSRRLERPAITGVLVREVVNFSSYWRSATFSSTVEPTIYLLAFGFGFGSLVSTVGGYDYVEFVGTGTVATAVLFSSAFPAMFGTFVKYQFQRTYDAILAAPVDTEELVTAEALWIATRAGVYGCVPMLVAMFFGLDPSLGDAHRPVHRLDLRLRLGLLRDRDRRLREVDRELQLHRQRRPHAALPRRRDVLPDHDAAGLGAGPRELQPALPLRRARARTRCSASTAGPTCWRVLATWSCSALLMWRHRDPRDDAQARRLAPPSRFHSMALRGRSQAPARSAGSMPGRRALPEPSWWRRRLVAEVWPSRGPQPRRGAGLRHRPRRWCSSPASTSSTSARRTTLHLPLAEAALAAGKHVICEKPLALDAAGAQLAGRCGRRLAGLPDRGAVRLPLLRDGARGARAGRQRATGPVRLLHGTYLQDWLLRPDDDDGAWTSGWAALRVRSPTSACTGATWPSSSPASASPGSRPGCSPRCPSAGDIP